MTRRRDNDDGSRPAIGSVDNALRVLTAFEETGQLRVANVARTLGVARSTAHRLLRVLALHGTRQSGSRFQSIRRRPVPAAPRGFDRTGTRSHHGRPSDHDRACGRTWGDRPPLGAEGNGDFLRRLDRDIETVASRRTSGSPPSRAREGGWTGSARRTRHECPPGPFARQTRGRYPDADETRKPAAHWERCHGLMTKWITSDGTSVS